ncbi:MAG: hypothetical protein JWP12_688 [Bacteroidetes bacterium]|nr:hypothetical protein [Bacteroidota bacterium]
MKKTIIYYFNNWWLPIWVFVLTTGLSIISDYRKNETFWYISYSLFIIGYLGLIPSAIYQFVKKKWLKGILTTLIFIVFFIYCLISAWCEFIN